jgi:hypothetical protein
MVDLTMPSPTAKAEIARKPGKHNGLPTIFFIFSPFFVSISTQREKKWHRNGEQEKHWKRREKRGERGGERERRTCCSNPVKNPSLSVSHINKLDSLELKLANT